MPPHTHTPNCPSRVCVTREEDVEVFRRGENTWNGECVSDVEQACAVWRQRVRIRKQKAHGAPILLIGWKRCHQLRCQLLRLPAFGRRGVEAALAHPLTCACVCARQMNYRSCPFDSLAQIRVQPCNGKNGQMFAIAERRKENSRDAFSGNCTRTGESSELLFVPFQHP